MNGLQVLRASILSKIFLAVLVCMCGSLVQVQGQSQFCHDCDCLLQKASAAQEQGRFDRSINLYIAARGYCPEAVVKVDSSMLRLFQAIEKLRKQADVAREQAELARDSLRIANDQLRVQIAETEWQHFKAEQERKIAESAKHNADSLLTHSNNLISAFYFFEGNLALACRDGKFGYVNKLGQAIVDYKYDKAENYMTVGLARVKRGETSYLLDRHGKEHPVEGLNIFNTPKFGFDLKFTLDLRDTKLSDFLNKIGARNRGKNPKPPQAIEADLLYGALFSKILTPSSMRQKVHSLDLSGWALQRIPERTYQLIALKILLLSNNRLMALSPRIEHWKELRVLDLSRNQLSSLPKEFASLHCLEELDLSNNQFKEFPRELLKIQSLCRVYLGGNSFMDLPSFATLKDSLTQVAPNCIWKFD